MAIKYKKNGNAFFRILRYIFGPEVPWPYRMLLLLTIGLLIGGAKFEENALKLQLLDRDAAIAGQASTDAAALSPAVQEVLVFRKKQYDRLIKGADMMFDFAKITFGALVGGLSALIGVRRRDESEGRPARRGGRA